MSSQQPDQSRRTKNKSRQPAKRTQRAKRLAAGTTAAAALYLGVPAPSADAAIIYHPGGFSVGNGQLHDWDVDGAGGNEWRVQRTSATGIPIVFYNYSSYTYQTLGFSTRRRGHINAAIPQANNGLGFVRRPMFDNAGAIRNLPAGTLVGPTLGTGYAFGNPHYHHVASGWYQRHYTNGNTNTFSNMGRVPGFASGVAGFVGFKFQSSGFPGATTHYGWAEMTFTPETGIDVLRWAYESDPDTGLLVGAVPEPSTATLAGLALLACGAAGVRRWRKGKRSAVQAE